jgi:hypothetical protein
VAIFDVSLYEPIRPGVNADSLAYSADNTIWPTADGGLLEASETLNAFTNVISVEIYEPVHPGPGADTTLYTADETVWPTADGGIIEGATDATDAAINANILFGDIYEHVVASDDLDAELIPAVIAEPGGGYYPIPRRPAAVVGHGYGVLPELDGESFGAIGAVGRGLGALPRLSGSAAGSIGVAGRSAGQIAVIYAAIIGQHGQIGRALGVLKTLSITTDGIAGTRGQAIGVITKLNGGAVGRHDDDEAAIMSCLLAA